MVIVPEMSVVKEGAAGLTLTLTTRAVVESAVSTGLAVVSVAVILAYTHETPAALVGTVYVVPFVIFSTPLVTSVPPVGPVRADVLLYHDHALV